jgi:holo-[acyl-carrier protein] synthase
MGVIGIGIDVVDIARFEQSLQRTPTLSDRLFVESERNLPLPSLAARFAAKEALAKALGAPEGLDWHDAVIVSDDDGKPSFELAGTVAAAVAAASVASVHLSLSHDAGCAVAMVVAEG